MTPGSIATELVAAAEASGIGIDDLFDAYEDWTEGPFRDSDWSPRVRAALRKVTPSNATAVYGALQHFVEA